MEALTSILKVCIYVKVSVHVCTCVFTVYVCVCVCGTCDMATSQRASKSSRIPCKYICMYVRMLWVYVCVWHAWYIFMHTCGMKQFCCKHSGPHKYLESMYICMYVYTYVRIYVYMYVLYVCVCAVCMINRRPSQVPWKYAYMYVHTHVCFICCACVWYVRMHTRCVIVCMYACTHVFVCVVWSCGRPAIVYCLCEWEQKRCVCLCVCVCACVCVCVCVCVCACTCVCVCMCVYMCVCVCVCV